MTHEKKSSWLIKNGMLPFEDAEKEELYLRRKLFYA